jgi:hypothetical protein
MEEKAQTRMKLYQKMMKDFSSFLDDFKSTADL